MSNPIVAENQNTGTTSWLITQPAGVHIQGYVNATSVASGGSLTFYVSCDGSTYSINVYRIGYYGGAGARLMTSITGLSAQSQGYYNGSASDGNGTLTNCPTAVIDNTTGLVEARFASSYTLSIPSNWVTGCYLVLFQDNRGYQSYTSFVVRAVGNEDYVIVRGDTTYCAYNNWGGKSLYAFSSSSGVAAVKDSFDRPSVNCNGGDYFVRNDISFIKWVESCGFNVGYLSDIDVHVSGASILTSHQAYISLGHDEYWTREMRDAVEAGIAGGMGAAFLGGNSCYWQVRLESGGQNGANRTLVCYRVAATDPQYGVDNTRVTTNWRSDPVNRPESTMMGIMFSNVLGTSNVAWTVDSSASSPLLTGTGLVAGQSYGSDLVGNECDKVQYGSPKNIQILGTTPYTSNVPSSDVSHTTVYVSSGGGLVFASGSISWTWGLDPYRYGASDVAVVPGMQQLMAHIMTALIRPRNPTGFSSFASVHR